MSIPINGDIKNAKEFADFVFLRLKNVTLRTLDYLSAKAMYLISVAYERLG